MFRFEAKNKKQIFIGLNKYGKPIYLNEKRLVMAHVQAVGSTGTNKTASLMNIIYQQVLYGNAAVLFDVKGGKGDEWMAHVAADAAKAADVPFYVIDLNGSNGCFNPGQNKSVSDYTELMNIAFNISHKGDIADVHRGQDRVVARNFAEFALERGLSFTEAANQFIDKFATGKGPGLNFLTCLQELAWLESLDVQRGIDIRRAIEDGAVIYVRGSSRNDSVIKAQQIFLQSVIQFAEARDVENGRPISILIDEARFQLSRPVVNSLNLLRDKKVQLLISHQSQNDWYDCVADITPEAVQASINENCTVKLVYKLQCPDTALYFSRKGGKVLLDEESRSFERRFGWAESKQAIRSLKQTEGYYIDSNIILSMPSGCGVLFASGLPEVIMTSPVPVKKDPENLKPTVFEKSGATGRSKFKTIEALI